MAIAARRQRSWAEHGLAHYENETPGVLADEGGYRVKRLYRLKAQEVYEWGQARFQAGQERYGDGHLQRYGLVDVMEELLDAANILHLTRGRLERQGAWGDKTLAAGFGRARWMLDQARDYVRMLDKHLPDEVCTDEKGEKRIWWPGRGEEQ